MARSLSLWTLIVLALAVGGWIAFGRDVGASMPSQPPAGGKAGTAPAAPAAVGSSDSAPADPTTAGSAGGSSSRSAASGITPIDDRTCVLEVEVVSGERVPPAGMPYVDVAAWLVDEPGLRQRARTDALGRARFQFVGAHAEQVRIQSGAGGSADALLSAERAQRATVRVPTRAIVRGRVVDAAGAGIEGADLVLLRWPDEATAAEELWHVGRSGERGAFELRLAAGGRLGAMRAPFAPSALYLVRLGRPDSPAEVQTYELVLGKSAAALLGIVRDVDGRAVRDAEIELRPEGKAPRGAERIAATRRATSADDGGFAVDQLPPGPLRWTARAAGHGWQQGTLELPPDVPTPLEIRLPPPAQVEGRARLGDDRPAPGAIVTAGVPGTLAFATTRARDDGSYTLHDLGSGSLRLDATLGAARDGTTLEVPAGRSATWHPVLKQPERQVELAGRLVDARDRPLGGWQIVVRGASTTPGRLLTAADGSFTVPVETPNDLDVRAYAPARDVASFADAIERGVDARNGPIRLVVGDGARSAVRARLTAAAAQPAGARVDVWHGERREHARYRSADDGSIEFDAPVGTLDLEVELAGHVPLRLRGVEVVAGVDTDLGLLQLELGGVLYGTVQDTDGRAIELCELSVIPSSPGKPRVLAECVAGEYRFPALPAGSYTLQAQAPGQAAWSWTVDIQQGQSLQRNLELHPGVTRRLRVVVPPGAGDWVTMLLKPVDGAVRWTARAPVARPSPELQGTAEFSASMAPGSYEAHAEARGHHASALVTFTVDGEAPATLRLTR